jgi:hypothetical protein
MTAINRDTDAVEALRARLATMSGLWPVRYHNRQSNATYDATQPFIVETPLGGPTPLAEISNGSGTPLTREWRRQWQLLLHVPVDSGLNYVQQAEAIDRTLRATPITIASGAIPLLLDDISRRPPRPASRGIAWMTVPVVVQYRFLAS